MLIAAKQIKNKVTKKSNTKKLFTEGKGEMANCLYFDRTLVSLSEKFATRFVIFQERSTLKLFC